MAKEEKTEPEPEEVTSLTRKGSSLERGCRRGPGQKIPQFQGSCEELRGWVFDSTDSQGADKFDTVRGNIARYIAMKFTYGTELKSSINKLEPITLTTPTTPADEAPRIENNIYKEEVREYV
eukprot:1894676-Ditylum_brightwellii.AAC.1